MQILFPNVVVMYDYSAFSSSQRCKCTKSRGGHGVKLNHTADHNHPLLPSLHCLQLSPMRGWCSSLTTPWRVPDYSYYCIVFDCLDVYFCQVTIAFSIPEDQGEGNDEEKEEREQGRSRRLDPTPSVVIRPGCRQGLLTAVRSSRTAVFSV